MRDLVGREAVAHHRAVGVSRGADAVLVDGGAPREILQECGREPHVVHPDSGSWPAAKPLLY